MSQSALHNSKFVLASDRPRAMGLRWLEQSHVVRAILTSIVYYCGGQIDPLLGWTSSPAVLWPPNGVLLSALLLAPTRFWWLYFLAVLPADLAISTAPLRYGVQFYVANSLQSLVAAGLIRLLAPPGRALDDMPSLVRFVAFGVLLGPVVSALFGGWTVNSLHPETRYWVAVRGWFLANALTNVWLVPALTMFASWLRGRRDDAPWRRSGPIEAIVLQAGLVTVLIIVFQLRHPKSEMLGAYLYAPLPFLLWAAVRRGPRGVSVALVLVVLLSIHGAAHKRGPFVTGTERQMMLQLQLVLLAISLPTLFLAVEVRERGRAIAALQASERERSRAQEELRESFAEVRDLAGRLINAQESERARIARDLHDDLSQQLAGISIGLSVLKHNLPPENHEEISRLQEAAVELAREVREISHELHPGLLQNAGLTAALRARCTELSNHKGCKVEFDGGDHLDGLGADLTLCLYRVAQEALGNVVRHADAQRVLLAIRRIDGEIELTVRDDGRGFEPAEVRALGGLGLISLEERVRMLGGKLFIKSEPRCGTELRVRVPLDDACQKKWETNVDVAIHSEESMTQ